MPESAVVFDAIVLAGGSGERLGGVDKGALIHGGRSLLDHALDAVAGARRVVVVGGGPPDRPVLHAVEDPPGGGPAAAISAGLARLDAEQPGVADLVVVLACDLVDPAPAVRSLLAVGRAVIAVDDAGREQYLTAVYPGPELARRAASTDLAGSSVRRLVDGLVADRIRVTIHDVDTPADLERLGVRDS